MTTCHCCTTVVTEAIVGTCVTSDLRPLLEHTCAAVASDRSATLSSMMSEKHRWNVSDVRILL
jgi:hypothetical protein